MWLNERRTCVKVLLDECMPFPLIARLSNIPHVFDHATRIGFAGLSNGKLYHHALTHYDLLITNDRHFRNADVYPVSETLGIVFVRIAPCTTDIVAPCLRRLFTALPSSKFVGHRIVLRREEWETVH